VCLYFTEICSDSEAGSFLRLIDFVYHSTLGLIVMQKKKKKKYLAGATLRKRRSKCKVGASSSVLLSRLELVDTQSF